jgi:T5SS/PEP-CTERM-associated repeat protein
LAARNLVWTGAAGDGNFSNPANWEDTATGMAALTPPTSIDFVSFQGTTGGTVGGTGYAETVTIGGLTSWTFDGSITLSGQPTAFTPVGLVIFTSALFSDATIDDAAASVQINGSGTTTVLTVENASTVTAAATSIGNDISSNGSLVVTGVNTTWHDIYDASISGSGVMLVGQAGPSNASQGSLTVTDYAVVTEDSSAVLGVGAGSTGTATVSDYGIWNTGTLFVVGESGDGSLTIETDGTVAGTSGATAYIGQNGQNQGTVTVSGTGVWTVGSALNIGQSGSATLSIAGTVTDTGTATIGAFNTGTGTVTVEDGGIWNTGTLLYVGQAGVGQLTIDGGGTVDGASTATATIGQIPGNASTVTVQGMGLWTVGSTLDIGSGGTATLSVGGTVTDTGSAVIGGFNSGSGTVTVSNGGIWNTGTLLDVGQGAYGTLDIQAGGSVIASSGATASIGAAATGTGAMTVSGTGVWNAGSALYVGQLGSGALSIAGTVTNTGVAAIGAGKGGMGTVTVLSGGVWNVGSLYVAQSTGSTGDLDIEAGGTVSLTAAYGSANPVVIIGQGAATNSPAVPAAMGTITVAGAGAELIAGNPIQLGGSSGGDATLTIDQGGSVSAATADSNVEFGFAMANRSPVVATLTIGDTDPATTAQSQLSVAGGVIIGRGGVATADIDYGGTLLVTDAAADGSSIAIGAGRSAGPNGASYIGGSGTAIVTGGTIDLSSTTAKITVGGYGVDGEMDVNSGGVVLAGDGLTVGAATKPSGSSYGAGTIYGGTGTVDIGQGGTVKVADATPAGTADVVIGGANASLNGAASPTTSGTVTVSGTGALLDTNGGDLVVGDQTQGGLTISKGGAVNAGTLDIGVTANGPGAVDIEGDGYTSVLTATGALNVGVAGQGVLTVSTGGTVALGGTVTIGTSGTVIGAGGVIDPPTFYYNDGETFGPLTVQATSGIVNTGAFVAESGQLELNGAVTGTGTLQVGSGGVLQLDQGVAATQTVELASTDATLAIKDPTGFASTIEGYTAGDTVTVYGIGADETPQYSQSDGNTTLTYGGGIALTFAGTFSSGEIDVQADNTPPPPPPVPCFLPGTHIRTTRGEVMVQDLTVGDTVVTLSGRRRRLCWIGHGRALATRGRRNAATPLIVRKGALADNVPNRDLRITKGHSLFLEGVLIPVEFLVNHRTILWDDMAQEVEVFHLELDEHDILIANGAAAESYRDDGNRWLFRNANSGWDQPPKPPCAPVLTGGAAVDAVWRRLLDRAGGPTSLPLTQDAQMALSVDGTLLAPTVLNEDLAVFVVAARPRALRLVSRSAVPLELGLARDARELGVAVRRVAARKGGWCRDIAAADARLAEGFHAFEAEAGVRWTSGDAALPADLFAGFKGEFELVVHLGGSTRYIEDGRALFAA